MAARLSSAVTSAPTQAPASDARPAPTSALLEVRDLTAAYGRVQALQPLSFHVAAGEVVVVLGPNGAGKSTLLRALMGQVQRSGFIRFEGRPVDALATDALAAAGLIMVPEGRGILGPLSVRDNLDLGSYMRRGQRAEVAADLERVFELFPRLKERQSQRAGSLSGGEQQMLAIGRAILGRPKLLMLDEPSLGLAPRVMDEILHSLETLKQSGLTILLVEQKAPLALRIASRAYVLRSGRIVMEAGAAELASEAALAQLYLGAHDHG
jgi:branched-chain amino acid transport system ATP-binding protein